MRLLILPLLGVALSACGSANPRVACESYVNALNACYDALDVDRPAGINAETTCAGQDVLTGSLAASTADYWNCQADAWASADCSDEDGLSDISAAAQACPAPTP